MRLAIIILNLYSLILIESTYAEIVFVAHVNHNWDLFSINDNGNNLIQLTTTPFDEKTPSWSFDGKKIVYATSDGHINILDVSTKKTQKIDTNRKSPMITPSFSPDNKEIVLAQFKPFSPNRKDDTDLIIYNIKTNETYKLISQYAIQMWPVWSPDRSNIVYSNIHCSAECGRIIQELWITDPDGGWARQLLMTHSLCQHPVWSPNGKKIAFSSDKSGNFDIWILYLDSGKLYQLTKNENLDVSPAWSPEGDKIAFISTRSGIMEIWIKNLVNKKLSKFRPFGNKPVECKDISWSINH